MDDVAGGAVRRLVDEDPVDRRRALEAGGGVDHVTGRHPFALARPGSEGDERLAGRDGDANLEPAVVRHRLADRERGANRAFGIVLVGDRRPEEGHDGVADELLDGAAVALELGAQLLVVRPQDRVDVLGVERLGPRREADEVGEEHRHDLSLPVWSLGHRYRRRSTS